MMESFKLTKSNNSDIVVVNDKIPITEIFNNIFNSNKEYDFFHLMNDDCIYRTKNWDLKLAKKGKIAHGYDCIENGMKCQFPMIDGDIARALGWLQLPTLNRYCGDNVWRFIGNALNILEFVPEVTIEHQWEGADPELTKQDMARFAEWLPWSFKDVNKVREAIYGK